MMLTMKRVAERMGVSSSTVAAAIRGGDLAAYRFGRCVRIEEGDLNSFLKRNRSFRGVTDEKADLRIRFQAILETQRSGVLSQKQRWEAVEKLLLKALGYSEEEVKKWDRRAS